MPLGEKPPPQGSCHFKDDHWCAFQSGYYPQNGQSGARMYPRSQQGLRLAPFSSPAPISFIRYESQDRPVLKQSCPCQSSLQLCSSPLSSALERWCLFVSSGRHPIPKSICFRSLNGSVGEDHIHAHRPFFVDSQPSRLTKSADRVCRLQRISRTRTSLSTTTHTCSGVSGLPPFRR